jgi:hypothetical protein
LFLAALYRAGCGKGSGCDTDNLWSGRAGCYPKRDEHMVEEKGNENILYKVHVMRTAGGRPFIG